MDDKKSRVKEFWNEAACGEKLYLFGHDQTERYNNQLERRYELEPFIRNFAEFEGQKGKKVLEIGVGLGADHQMFAEAGAELYGCDLTERAVEYTRKRMKLFNLKSEIIVADAEQLPYASDSFDTVYSYGVLHHSPDTKRALEEVYRVLKTNGEARIMIYHKESIVGLMLWMRYGLLALKPFRSLEYIYANYLESPGTQAFTIDEARLICSKFRETNIDIVLSHGDLLSSSAGQRHNGILLNFGRKIFPRWIVRKFFYKNGLLMLIHLVK